MAWVRRTVQGYGREAVLGRSGSACKRIRILPDLAVFACIQGSCGLTKG